MSEEKVGVVFKFFAGASVAALELTEAGLKIGDKVHFLGHTTDFTQLVESIQVEHDSVDEASAGDKVGLKVVERVRPHDIMYKVVGA